VDYLNASMFAKIDEDEYEFEHSVLTNCRTHSDSGKPISVEHILKCQKMTQQEREYEIENLLNNTPCVKLLRMKRGASVLCTVNIDMDNEICNGSQGIVLDIYEKEETTIIVVKFSNGLIRHIGPHLWQSEEYPMISIKQYPLCLAWALTIHKIQGATLALAEIDIGQSIFEYGQSYVALSRVKSLDGLYLSAFQPERIRANPKVVEFYNNMKPLDTIDFASFELKEDEPPSNVKIIKL
jgi:ATP-dependent DNA helicase PIF1